MADHDLNTSTKLIDGRLHIQDSDGLYAPVPTGMDEARDLKGSGPARKSLDEASGKAYCVVEPDKLLDYLDQSIRDGAVISRAYQVETAQASGKADLRRMVRVSDDIAILRPDGDTGRLKAQNLTAGDLIDTTDPTDMFGVSFDTFSKDYQIYDRYVMHQACASTRYINFEPGMPAMGMSEPGGVVDGRGSLMVNVLFNENDSAGEVVPLEDLSVPCVMLDGSKSSMNIQCLDNFIAGSEDLSMCRADFEPEQANLFKGRMLDEMIRSDYNAYQVHAELGETRESVLKEQLASGNPYLERDAETIGKSLQAAQSGSKGPAATGRMEVVLGDTGISGVGGERMFSRFVKEHNVLEMRAMESGRTTQMQEKIEAHERKTGQAATDLEKRALFMGRSPKMQAMIEQYERESGQAGAGPDAGNIDKPPTSPVD